MYGSARETPLQVCPRVLQKTIDKKRAERPVLPAPSKVRCDSKLYTSTPPAAVLQPLVSCTEFGTCYQCENMQSAINISVLPCKMHASTTCFSASSHCCRARAVISMLCGARASVRSKRWRCSYSTPSTGVIQNPHQIRGSTPCARFLQDCPARDTGLGF